MTSVLIMSGGRSSRMRATAGPQHKALVPVLGVPMLERNLVALLAAGFSDLHLAVAHGETALLDFVQQRAQPLAAAFGAQLSLLLEATPLGTLGACARCAVPGDVLVVNVDNLSSLDLNALLQTHRRCAAPFTIACHVETFRMPFGQLELQGEQVVHLHEKPEMRYLVSSGTYALDERARALILPGQAAGPPELLQALARQGLAAAAHRHDAPWIDVNDGTALTRASALLFARQDMECPWLAPHEHRVLIAGGVSQQVRISRAGLPLSPSGGATQTWPGAQPVAVFDEALPCGRVIRCHLFWATGPVPGEDSLVDLADDRVLSSSRAQARAHAHLQQHRLLECRT